MRGLLIGNNGFLGSGIYKAFQILGIPLFGVNERIIMNILEEEFDFIINADGNSSKQLAAESVKGF